MYADILKNIVNNYERYKNIAVNLEWTESDSKYYEWYRNNYTRICVTVCGFPEGYVKNNFEQAYVQTVMTYMAYMEEFKEDFRILRLPELLQYMTQAENFYADYITYKELRMKTVTEDYLIQQIKWYAGDDIPESEINSVIPYLTGAENIEIGSSCCCYDHTFISVKDNSVMLADCGIL